MKKALFGVATFVFVVILLETVLGVMFFLKDARTQLIQLDHTKDMPYLYYAFEPEANGRNRDGFLSESERNKNEDFYRVAILGGSVAEGLGSARDETGELVLETALRRATGSARIELVNAGMSGYVVEQEFILLQLVLQKYEPDLVFGLDGYNDLMSYKLNRHTSKTIPLPPQNYRDFLVIRKGKDEKTFLHRFSGLFRNLSRSLAFVSRLASGESAYDFSHMTAQDYAVTSNAYIDIVRDTRDFCEAKRICYVSFLQPVRYYDRQKENFLLTKDEAPELARLYHHFEEKLAQLPDTYSLTRVLDEHTDVYTDNCHVTLEGNRILADEIAERLAPIIFADASFKRLAGE